MFVYVIAKNQDFNPAFVKHSRNKQSLVSRNKQNIQFSEVQNSLKRKTVKICFSLFLNLTMKGSALRVIIRIERKIKNMKQTFGLGSPRICSEYVPHI